MAEFTKERLQEIAEDGFLKHGEAKAMARQLLAGLEQEPVYQACKEAGVWVDIEPGDVGSLKANGEQVREVYAAPQLPQPAVPGEVQKLKDGRGFKYVKDGVHYSVNYANGWNQCRAAMLQGADGTLTNEGTIPVMQFKPVADLYGLTSPTGGETSFTFDAVEARDFIDGGWLCQEYVTLERYQEAMLQGAEPVQEWIPCSERMPEAMVSVLATGDWFDYAVTAWSGKEWLDFDDYEPPVTHWMPLPSPPNQSSES